MHGGCTKHGKYFCRASLGKLVALSIYLPDSGKHLDVFMEALVSVEQVMDWWREAHGITRFFVGLDANTDLHGVGESSMLVGDCTHTRREIKHTLLKTDCAGKLLGKCS